MGCYDYINTFGSRGSFESENHTCSWFDLAVPPSLSILGDDGDK